jgi:hypothetical protein
MAAAQLGPVALSGMHDCGHPHAANVLGGVKAGEFRSDVSVESVPSVRRGHLHPASDGVVRGRGDSATALHALTNTARVAFAPGPRHPTMLS